MAKKGRLDFGLAEEGCLGKCPGGFVYGGGGGVCASEWEKEGVV